MSDQPEERRADGSEEPTSVDLGEPTRQTEEAERAMAEQERPDLDERHEQIATRRKPMGPPLQEPEERDEERPRERTEDPVDPQE
jgi:hypothetical protein